MRGSNEKMTRSSLVVTRHDRRGSCVVMTADGPASSPTAATLVTFCTTVCYNPSLTAVLVCSVIYMLMFIHIFICDSTDSYVCATTSTIVSW